MIVAAVEIVKGLVGQVRNALGIAAGIQAVKRVREQGLLALLGQHGIRRGIHALHLIVDHALVGPGAVGAFRLHVPAFLAEDILADAGMKDRVDVDVDEIVKIAQVGAGHRIAGLVRKVKALRKVCSEPFEQLHEGLLDRILVRAAEHRMLQNVGHARGIRGRRAEAHAEAFVFVRVDHGEQLRARGLMLPEAGLAAHFRHVPFREQGEAVFVHVWGILVLEFVAEAGNRPAHYR